MMRLTSDSSAIPARNYHHTELVGSPQGAALVFRAAWSDPRSWHWKRYPRSWTVRLPWHGLLEAECRCIAAKVLIITPWFIGVFDFTHIVIEPIVQDGSPQKEVIVASPVRRVTDHWGVLKASFIIKSNLSCHETQNICRIVLPYPKLCVLLCHYDLE